MIVLFAFIGPLFSKYDYTTQLRGMENLAPSWEHPFGTDGLGRAFDPYDVRHARLFDHRRRSQPDRPGDRLCLRVDIGLFGGLVDNIMMRIVELIYSIPDILIVLLLTTVLKQPLQTMFNNSTSPFIKTLATLGPSLFSIFIAFGLLYWVSNARIIRGQVIMLKQQEYITAAKALGASSSRFIKKHLLPNCIGQLIVTTCCRYPMRYF